eukprot:11687292-Ditylum_brightwellii.AAC.1
MEMNQKLQLEADEALVLKDQRAWQQRWSLLPGITSFSQWETSNHLCGMKIVMQQQIRIAEQ